MAPTAQDDRLLLVQCAQCRLGQPLVQPLVQVVGVLVPVLALVPNPRLSLRIVKFWPTNIMLTIVMMMMMMKESIWSSRMMTQAASARSLCRPVLLQLPNEARVRTMVLGLARAKAQAPARSCRDPPQQLLLLLLMTLADPWWTLRAQARPRMRKREALQVALRVARCCMLAATRTAPQMRSSLI